VGWRRTAEELIDPLAKDLECGTAKPQSSSWLDAVVAELRTVVGGPIAKGFGELNRYADHVVIGEAV